MKTSPRPSEARPPELIARLEAYAARHRSLENYVLAYFVALAVWLFRPAARREFANFPRGGGYGK